MQSQRLWFNLYFTFYLLPPSEKILIQGQQFENLTKFFLDGTDDAIKFRQTLQKLTEKLILVDPLSIWSVKDLYPTVESLKIDLHQMPSCIENQDSLRFELVLLKVLKGEAIHVVVYGGSNCAQGMFPEILRDWWNKVIQPISGSRLNLKLIGIGGTGSAYYQFCHEIYLEDNEKVDLVILETAVNDVVDKVSGTSNTNRSLALERLTRLLLGRSEKPAVFYANLFMVQGFRCTNLADFGQELISKLYGITTFNLRCLNCRLYKGIYYVESRSFDVQDGWHSKLMGHAQLALMIIHVISNAFAKIQQDLKGFGLSDISESWFNALGSTISQLPSPIYATGEDRITIPPKCWANLTPNFKQRLIHNTLTLRVVENAGFKHVARVMIGEGSYSAENVSRLDAFGGLRSDTVNAQVTVSFLVSSQRFGSVTPGQEDNLMPVTLQRTDGPATTASVGILSRYNRESGTVEAWLDDSYDKRKRIPLTSSSSQTAVAILSTHVQPGTHTISWRVVEGGLSVLVGVFVG